MVLVGAKEWTEEQMTIFIVRWQKTLLQSPLRLWYVGSGLTGVACRVGVASADANPIKNTHAAPCAAQRWR